MYVAVDASVDFTVEVATVFAVSVISVVAEAVVVTLSYVTAGCAVQEEKIIAARNNAVIFFIAENVANLSTINRNIPFSSRFLF